MLDALKGAAIILVVLGHSVGSWKLAQLIFSFHMPLFLFLSGTTAGIQYRRGGIRLSRRAWALLVPYFVWLFIFVFVSWPTFQPKLMVSVLNPRAGSLWYLYVLFCMWLVLWVLDRLPGSTSRWVILVAAAALLLPHPGAVEPYSVEQLSGLATNSLSQANTAAGVLGWRSVLWFFPFFGVGFLCTTEGMRQTFARSRNWIGAGVAWALLIVVLWPPFAVPGQAPSIPGFGAVTGLGDYFYIWYRYLLAAAGIATVIGALTHVTGRLESWLAWLGRRSLAIYVMHVPFLAWSPFVLLGPLKPLWGPLVWLGNAVYATGMSVLLAVPIKRNPVANSILLGAVWPRLPLPSLAAYSCAAGACGFVLVYLQRRGTLRALVVFVVITAVLALAPRIWQRLSGAPQPA